MPMPLLVCPNCIYHTFLHICTVLAAIFLINLGQPVDLLIFVLHRFVTLCIFWGWAKTFHNLDNPTQFSWVSVCRIKSLSRIELPHFDTVWYGNGHLSYKNYSSNLSTIFSRPFD